MPLMKPNQAPVSPSITRPCRGVAVGPLWFPYVHGAGRVGKLWGVGKMEKISEVFAEHMAGRTFKYPKTTPDIKDDWACKEIMNYSWIERLRYNLHNLHSQINTEMKSSWVDKHSIKDQLIKMPIVWDKKGHWLISGKNHLNWFQHLCRRTSGQEGPNSLEKQEVCRAMETHRVVVTEKRARQIWKPR